ncbi:MAG: acetoin utilization deacetylase AcuC-like enzyme [Cellvibrionaceae bacterium]|jgi:acetoin utilization deacetylase AcuC-like enzyme
MTTIFSFAPAYAHDFTGHPEHAGRGRAVMRVLEANQILERLVLTPPAPASYAQISRAHSSAVIDRVQALSLRGGGQLDADTYMTEASHDLALLAAGTVTNAALDIANGQHKNGYVFVRPPGHHAEYDRSMGFCLFNNVAVAVKELQASTNTKRIMVVDIDVHHGNGTQDIFYDDDSVLFVSVHQHSPFFYPGTGSAKETGKDAGVGFNLNIPLEAGVGDKGYYAVIDEVITLAARRFEPEMILVSAGFDAHWQDPLAAMELSLTGYAGLTQKLISLADELCGGRILFVQEGGYMLDILAYAALNTLFALKGIDKIIDPAGLSRASEFPNVEPVIRGLQLLHLLI